MLAGQEFLEAIGISWEEVHEVWDVLEVHGVQGIYGVHKVSLGRRFGRRKESKTPAKSLAGEDKHTCNYHIEAQRWWTKVQHTR